MSSSGASGSVRRERTPPMTKFDGLTFKQGLTQVGVPSNQAEALSELIRDQVVANAATKEDLLDVEKSVNLHIDRIEAVLIERIDRGEERVRSELKQLGQQMTIKLGSLAVAAVVIILSAMALFV